MGDTYYQLYTVRGIVILDKDMIGKQIKGIPVVASESTVIEYVCRGWVDELFMACPHNYKTRRELVAQFVDMGIVVHENLFENKELILNRQMVEHMGGYTVLTTTLNYVPQAIDRHCRMNCWMYHYRNLICNPGTVNLHSVAGTDLLLTGESW